LATYGKYNVLCGTRNDLVVTLPTPALPASAANTTAGIDTAINTALAPYGLNATGGQRLSALQVNSGDLIAEDWAANSSVSYTYCLNLISLLGSLCQSNYFPLFACTSSPIRMEITLIDSARKGLMTITDLTSIQLSNVEYIANFIELSDTAMSMIMQSLNSQPLQFVVPDWKNFGGTASGISTTVDTISQYNFAIPAKYSSLKSIFCCLRDQLTGNLTYYPFSSVSNGLESYYFRIGSQIMPAKSPNTFPEVFSELVKAIGSMSDINHQPSIEKYSFTLVNSVASVVNTNSMKLSSSISSGSFYIGLDLESYANSDKMSIFSGYNSNTDDIFLVLSYGGSAAQKNGLMAQKPGVASLRLDAYANFDTVIVFENGTCYVRF